MNEAISSNILGRALSCPNVIPISNNGIVIRIGVKIIPIPFKNEDIVKAVASPKDHEVAKIYGVDDIDDDEVDKSDLRAVDSHHKSN